MNNKAQCISHYETFIKQLMFIQYKQNCKRESKKDIAEWYKPVFDSIDQQLVQSPKVKKQQSKAANSVKKQKEKKASGEGMITKNQSKQLKILMKKNEQYNEVPLNQFIDFFIKDSNSKFSMHFEYFECFLLALKNTCVLDIVENEKFDEKSKSLQAQKLTTIKLKNSVLRELILENKRGQGSDSAKEDLGHAEKDLNWQSEYKRSLADVQF